MIIFGVDPGFALTGYGIIEVEKSKLKLLEAGCISTKAGELFTARCEKCGLAFDYQCSDLSFSAWYKDGYVECPRCRQPVRHSATANTFKVEEINY